jgi:hypothetical protein
MLIVIGCFSLVAWAIYLIGFGLKTEFEINQEQ